MIDLNGVLAPAFTIRVFNMLDSQCVLCHTAPQGSRTAIWGLLAYIRERVHPRAGTVYADLVAAPGGAPASPGATAGPRHSYRQMARIVADEMDLEERYANPNIDPATVVVSPRPRSAPGRAAAHATSPPPTGMRGAAAVSAAPGKAVSWDVDTRSPAPAAPAMDGQRKQAAGGTAARQGAAALADGDAPRSYVPHSRPHSAPRSASASRPGAPGTGFIGKVFPGAMEAATGVPACFQPAANACSGPRWRDVQLPYGAWDVARLEESITVRCKIYVFCCCWALPCAVSQRVVG